MEPCFESALKKSTLRRSLCSWCLSCRTMMMRCKIGASLRMRRDSTFGLVCKDAGLEIISARRRDCGPKGGHRIGPRLLRVIQPNESSHVHVPCFLFLDSQLSSLSHKHIPKCRLFTFWTTLLVISDHWSMPLKRSAIRSNGSSHLKMCQTQRYQFSPPPNQLSQTDSPKTDRLPRNSFSPV